VGRVFNAASGRDLAAKFIFDMNPDDLVERGLAFEAKRQRDPVAPAQRSEQALQKIARRTLDNGTPVHSFQTLLQALSTIVRNTCRTRDSKSASLTFQMLTTPDTTQRRALELLQAITV